MENFDWIAFFNIYKNVYADINKQIWRSLLCIAHFATVYWMVWICKICPCWVLRTSQIRLFVEQMCVRTFKRQIHVQKVLQQQEARQDCSWVDFGKNLLFVMWERCCVLFYTISSLTWSHAGKETSAHRFYYDTKCGNISYCSSP